ncbi:hypothetical protein CDL15_Pgr004607 [Punica granatum]|uniref:Uncharacterized protein n=1 Tax=Punica granatum TaxID=22663 RepID=A0A218WR54_PUNGR|nr:hypothetical protein CDL15_Pgr004607 [Punica granatum]
MEFFVSVAITIGVNSCSEPTDVEEPTESVFKEETVAEGHRRVWNWVYEKSASPPPRSATTSEGCRRE